VSTLPLRLGRFEAAGSRVMCSGLRWLRPDGHVCRANEIVAYCKIELTGANAVFGEERFDLQVALAPGLGGRIHHAPHVSYGGYLDRLSMFDWREDTIWATLEDPSAGDVAAADEPELLFLAGRRFSEIAENRSGILTGWHDRARSWWGEEAHRTIVAAGTCEMDAIFRGDDGHFGDVFRTVAGPVQIALTQNEPLVSCAPILVEQLSRTPAQMAAIREDAARGLLSGPTAPSAEEWIFVGALLRALESCPIGEDYELLSRSGLSRIGPAAAVCLSLNAEMARMPRHRRHGYALNIQNFRLANVGPAIRSWLRTDFEIAPRSVDEVAADYRRLCAAAPDTTFFIVNRFSSRHYELIQSYYGFDAAATAGLAGPYGKELNLVLHDLARELPNLAIIDADAIAAELGMWLHVPDGIHGSGPFNAELRSELLRQVRARAIPDLRLRAN